MRPARRSLVAAGLTLALGACGSLLAARDAPPPTDYRLAPELNLPADLPKRDVVLTVAEPIAEGSLDSARIAIVSGGRLDRLADVTWSDRATVMLQFQIVQAFQKTERLRAVGTDRDDLPGRYLLQTSLDAFQLEPDGETYSAAVTLHARLLSLPARDVAASRTFTARAPASAKSNEAAVAAFNKAVAAVLDELVPWVLEKAKG